MKFATAVMLAFSGLLFTQQGLGQIFYANTTQGIDRITVSEFDCTVKNMPIACANDYFSLALFGDTLYYLSVTQGLNRTFLSKPGHCEKVMDIEPLNSLTAGKDGMLYGAMATNLVKIDPHKQTIETFQIPFSAAGDLIFYNDHLYLAANPNAIVQINTDTPMKSFVYFSLDRAGIYGLTSVEGSCNSNTVYAFAANGVQTQLIKLDMEMKKSLGITCTIPGTYHDAASSTETGKFSGFQVYSLEKRNICVGSSKPSFIKVIASGSISPPVYQLNNTVSNSTGMFENLKEGTYHIHISSKDSCFADTTVTITKGFCEVQFPNAFTPNDDGLNDIFRPLGLTAGGNVLLTIYNRWGKKIFETDNFSRGWNGKVNGFVQAPGTYIWTFKYAGTNKAATLIKGTVILMR